MINLKEMFGRRFRVVYEESYIAERGVHGKAEEPWLYILPCIHGHIFPWGQDTLAASANKRGAVAKRLQALPCCRVLQDGSDGVTVGFKVEDFETVASIMQPRRKRQMSLEQKAKLIELGRANRFGVG